MGIFQALEVLGIMTTSLLLLTFQMLKGSENQNSRKEPQKISTQLKMEQSEFSSFSNMEMEKLFEDSVPCRVRAKRGCTTHPRSIAERVRRTRIRDRIRKLQELVPIIVLINSMKIKACTLSTLRLDGSTHQD